MYRLMVYFMQQPGKGAWEIFFLQVHPAWGRISKSRVHNNDKKEADHGYSNR